MKYGMKALKYILLLLTVTVGVSGAWGQTDYSGVYYIGSNGYDGNPANTNNFYLCPTEGWAFFVSDDTNPATVTGTDNGKPFLTTYRCKTNNYHSGDPSDAKWTITKIANSDYYYIQQTSTGRYMVSNGAVSSNPDRARVHLETISNPNDLDEKAQFAIYLYSGHIVIKPIGITDGTSSAHSDHKNHKWLTVNQGNKNNLAGTNDRQDGPSSFPKTGGIVCLYTESDARADFYLETISPTIVYDSSGQVVISHPSSAVTIYYTLDGSDPTTSSTQYTEPITLSADITTVKAIAVYPSNAVSNPTTFPAFKLGDSHPYLIQSQENTNYYMIPVTDTNNTNGFTKTNTTTLGQPAMMWYFLNAGTVGGVQYYYIINKSTGQYVYYHNPNNNYLISISVDDFDSSFAALDDEGKEPYRFSINAATGGGYNLCPKSKADRCITKGTSNQHNSYIGTQSSKTDAKGRWDFISVPDQKMPATTSPVTVSTASAAAYYTIENERNAGNYISPATYVTTTTSVTDDDKWYFLQADKEDWLTYYHIVNAVSGEYLYLNRTGSNAVSTKALSEDTANPDKYQFVLAPSATGAYYIIPKSQAIQRTRQFTSLYSDATNPLQTKNRRYYVANTSTDPENTGGDDAYIKWTFAHADLNACQAPVFPESEGNIIMSCPTFGAEIHYTIDGSTPTASTPTVYTDETNLSTSSQYLVKAIAVFKNDPSDPTKDVSSSDVMLFNKPDVTLSQDTYTYNKAACEPTVSKVAITVSGTEYEAATSPTPTYAISGYVNNINAGTATVNLVDNINNDNIFFGNFTKDFTINPVTLTITPDDGQEMEYGDDFTLTFEKAGILSGDNWEEVLTGALGYEGEETLGIHTITQGSLTSNVPNYTISFTTGKTFTITKKSLGDNIRTPAPNITCDISETNGTYSIVVKQGGRNLTLGADYTKSSESGVSDGKYYEVKVDGQGNYKDGFSVKLAKIKLSKLAGSVAPGGAALFVSNSGEGNFVVPDNMKAYIVTGISGNFLVKEELDNIPENKPVLLISDIDANGFLVQPEANATAPTGENMLEVRATDWADIPAATIYLLYKGEFVLNAAGTLPAGKIYLPRPAGAPSRLFINWSGTTGTEIPQLSALDSQPSTGNWYTLDGRRLNGRPSKKGLYLKNGKKEVIR